MKIINPFTEADKTWSWRKAGTALCFALFGFAVIGNQIVNKFVELPASYQAIIAGVFVFYFGKRMLEGVKLVNNEKESEG